MGIICLSQVPLSARWMIGKAVIQNSEVPNVDRAVSMPLASVSHTGVTSCMPLDLKKTATEIMASTNCSTYLTKASRLTANPDDDDDRADHMSSFVLMYRKRSRKDQQ